MKSFLIINRFSHRARTVSLILLSIFLFDQLAVAANGINHLRIHADLKDRKIVYQRSNDNKFNLLIGQHDNSDGNLLSRVPDKVKYQLQKQKLPNNLRKFSLSDNSSKSTSETIQKEREKNGENADEILLNASGPQTPEMSSFESVNTTTMVDPYTGDLTYSLPVMEIPGAHDGGYSVALAYQSGAGANDDASWVGHGWNLNPGAINRIKKGFPDDIRAKAIEYINDVPPNSTITLAPATGAEAFSINLNLSKFYRYNNYKGFGGGYSAGLSAFDGILGATWIMEDGKGSFSPYVNPFGILSRATKGQRTQTAYRSSRLNFADVAKSTIRNSANRMLSTASTAYFNYGISLLADQGGPMNIVEYTGISKSAEFGMVGDIPFVVTGLSGSLRGTLTTQYPRVSITRNAFGYLYSDKTYQSTNNDDVRNEDIMDYHLEKNGQYSKRDEYLPIPVSDVDVYNVSAEGLTGAFRGYWGRPTMVFPPSTYNTTQMTSVHAQGHIGTTIGLGVSVDDGECWQKNSHDWKDNGSSDDFKTSIELLSVGSTTVEEDEPFNFRFFSDMGGNTILDKNFTSIPVSVSSTPTIGSNQISDYKVKDANTLDNSGRVGRNSFINYHTNEYLSLNVNSKSPYKAFEWEYASSTNDYIDRSEPSIAEHIGEFQITTPLGENYIYGLPVYNRNEQSMSYKIQSPDITPINPGDNPFTYIVNADISGDRVKVGEKHNYAYPAYYLLTSIRSKDYSDVNNNYLLDEEDFGGYTKFGYRRAYGNVQKIGTSGWFNWRVPFTGLNLEQNHLDNAQDNMGSFTCGEKEIYYTQAIETKTHIAVFVTNQSPAFQIGSVTLPGTAGSTNPRLDGMSANANNIEAANGIANSSTFSYMPEFLEKIMLFAKPIGGTGGGSTIYKLIKTVRFDYDSTIWPNSPGADINSSIPDIGKLTLRKIWVENEDVKMAKVSPYLFDYIYPNASALYPSKYSSLADYYNGKDEDPDYVQVSGECVDRWGNYMDDGATNRSKLKPFTVQNPSTSFDPAAWQLKNIQVPSGSQIHIQYEQDDYTMVQDKPASILMPLIQSTGNNQDENNNYQIDIHELYPDLSLSQCTTYCKYLIDYFSKNKNPYIYFKFLYKIADPPGAPTSNLPLETNDCSTEYIDGYVKVDDITVSDNILTFNLGDGSTPPSTASLSFPTGAYKLPKYVCFDYAKTETGMQSGSCFPGMDMSNPEPEELAHLLKQKISNEVNNFLTNSSICAHIVEPLSYLRLPIDPSLMAKKGGGLRVKRLLRYDKGLQTDESDKSLYGVEYIYKNNERVSSGVASNEPAEGREENTLVDFIQKRQPQKWFQKAISGLDKEQFEGPYGESELPPPSVGYKAVQVKNIHRGKTDDGINIYEYYTSEDYPYDAKYDSKNLFFDHTGIEKSDNHDFSLGLLQHTITNELRTVQSYHHIIYNIAGRPKSETKYLGDNLGNMVYRKYYEYFKPGEKIPLQTEVVSNVSQNDYRGVDMDIIIERKRTIEKYKSTAINGDLAVALMYPPFPSGGGCVWTSKKESEISTLVTNKTTYLPVVLKSVAETKNGMNHIADNISFNTYSGNAVVVKSIDEFNKVTNPAGIPGKYYSYTQPAILHYPNFNQIAFNQNKYILTSGIITTSGSNLILTFSSAVNNLAVGDLLQVKNSSGSILDYFFIKSITSLTVYEVEHYDNAVSVTYPLSFTFCKVEKSGRLNTPDEVVGNMVTYDKIGAGVFTPAALSMFNTSGFSGNSGVSLNLGKWGYTGDLGTIQCSHQLCISSGNSDLVYESFIPTGTDDLYIVKYNPINCYHDAYASFESIVGTPIALNPDYVAGGTNMGMSSPHEIIGFEFLGKTGGSFTYALNVNGGGCSWDLNYIYTNGASTYTTTVSESLCSCVEAIPNVLSLNALKFDNRWDYSPLKEYSNMPNIQLANNFSDNKYRLWRVRESYAYKKDRNITYSNSAARNYNSGMFEFIYHDWKDGINSGTDPSWVLSATLQNYSPHGESVEESDALGVKASMQFSDNKTMPSLVIKNGLHNSAFFESFEDYPDLTSLQAKYTSGTFAFSSTYNNISFTTAGKNCLELPTNSYIDIPFQNTVDYDGGTLLVKYWCSVWPTFDETANGNMPTNPGCDVKFLTNGSVTTTVAATKIATVGTWCLFQAELTTPSLPPGSNVYKIRMQSKTDVFVDDIRYQPKQSMMNTYVYDAAKKRLLAEFGDDHMPLKYVYNPDGKLIRKIVFTEKGPKVITEGHYNNGYKETRSQ